MARCAAATARARRSAFARMVSCAAATRAAAARIRASRSVCSASSAAARRRVRPRVVTAVFVTAPTAVTPIRSALAVNPSTHSAVATTTPPTMRVVATTTAAIMPGPPSQPTAVIRHTPLALWVTKR